MKKIILFVIFLFLEFSWGQTSETIVPFFKDENNKKEIQEAEKLSKILPKNTEKIRTISFEKFENNYHSQAFIYDDTNEVNFGFFEEILNKISEILVRLFHFDLNNSEEKFFKALYIISFLVVLGISIWLISKYKGRWFSERENKKFVNLVDEVEKNIHLVNFKKLIETSENQNDTRKSIRFYYLWLLKSLSDKNIIEWHIEKTNSDYINEIKNPQLKKDFSELSQLYNYVWYGEFSVQSYDYQNIKIKFIKYITSKN